MVKPAITAADLDAAEADRAAARKFFWGWLVAATSLTLVGNAAHALLEYIPHTALSLAVSLVPPIIALVSIHALHVMSSVRISRRALRIEWSWSYGFTLLVTFALALIAAILSWSGLFAVALEGGWSDHRLAALWPVCIDAGIVVASVSLVVLRPASSADLRAARRAAAASVVSVPAAPTPTAPPRTPSLSAPTPTAPVTPTTTTPPPSPTPPTETSVTITDEHRAAAERIVADGAVSKPVSEVAAVVARIADGHSQTRIATDTGINRRTVAKIAAAHADAEPVRVLTAVGAE
jgi:hypothetical protein